MHLLLEKFILMIIDSLNLICILLEIKFLL